MSAVFELPTLNESKRVASGGGSGSIVEEAARIVAEARAEGEEIRRAAYAEGLAEGHAAGIAETREALAPAQEALAAALRGFVETQAELAREAEQAAVELGLALAEKVIGASLEVRPELVLEVCRGALRRTIERDHLVLLVNPDDLELVREGAEAVAASLGGIGRLEVTVERRVPRGGCIVRTRDGELDARVGEQLDRAAEVLRDALADG